MNFDKIIDTLASEYGWTVDDVEDLTCRRINSLVEIIKKRKEQEEYLDRLHISLQSTAIVKAFGAAMSKRDIEISELIGPAPGEVVKTIPENNKPKVKEWKSEAKKRGLKAGN